MRFARPCRSTGVCTAQDAAYLGISAGAGAAFLGLVSSGGVGLRLLGVLFRLLQDGRLQLLACQAAHLWQSPQLHSVLGVSIILTGLRDSAKLFTNAHSSQVTK